MGSNRPEFLNEQFVHKSYVQTGQILEALITKIEETGLRMLIGNRVEATCPLVHTSEMTSTIKLTKRFKVGQVLTVRVWESQGKQVIVTHKKTLVNDTLPPLASIEDFEEGKVAHGVVARLFNDAVLVQFFNKVQGSMPLTVLAKQGVTDLEESFRVGQVVRCVILKHVSASNKRGYLLTLGLDVGNVDNIKLLLSDSTTSTAAPAAGTVSCIVLKDEGRSLMVKMNNGRTGFIPREHMSDLGVSRKSFPPGLQVDAVILSESNSKVMLSAKPLLLASIKANLEDRVPSSFADLAPGMIVVGFVHKVDSSGVFVRFREGLTVLAPRPNLAERFVPDPSELFKEGVSVRCLVQRVDVSKERAIVTFKHSLVGSSSGPNCYLRTLLRERWEDYNSQSDNSIIDWKRFPIGSITNATVTSNESYGTILLAEDGVTVMLAKGSQQMEIGAKKDVVVLDMNYSSKCMDVSFDLKLINAKKSRSVSAGDQIMGKIVFIKDSYLGAVVGGRVVLVMHADFHCPYKTCQEFSLGQQVQLLVRFAPSTAESSFPHADCVICTLYSENDARDQIARVQHEAEQADAKNVHRLQIGWTDTWTIKEIDETEVQFVHFDVYLTFCACR